MGGDRRALAKAFVDAMDNGSPATTQSWRGQSATGAITPGVPGVGNLRSDPTALIAFRPGLKLTREYETELGEFVLVKNSNIRYGPSTDDQVIEVLDSGTGVEVVGKVVNERWMLIAIDNEIRGFIFETLLKRRPGSELELAGGPTKRPRLCRSFKQTLESPDGSDEWSGVACKIDGRWALQQADTTGPTRLF
ncbi:MAG: SH3 domain-containing protein [Pseudomonadota bacterium]